MNRDELTRRLRSAFLQELGELERLGGHGRGPGVHGRIMLEQVRVVLAHDRAAGTGGRHHDLGVLEDVHHAARDGASFIEEAAVESRLAAAGLLRREVHADP